MGGSRGEAVSSRSFDLLNSRVSTYDQKRFVGLRLLFDPVLHSSLDDLVRRKRPEKEGEQKNIVQLCTRQFLEHQIGFCA